MIKDLLRSNSDFLILTMVWIAAGVFMGPGIYLVLPVILILLWRKKRYLDLLLGFFIILILSDSRNPALFFAVKLKDIYIVFMAAFIFLSSAEFRPFNPLFIRFLPFIIIAVFFIVNADNLVQTLQKTLSYTLILFVVPNYVTKAVRDNGPLALQRIVYLGTFVLLLGLVLRVVYPAFVVMSERYIGMLGNPNGLGLFCLLFFIVFTVIRDINPELFSKKTIWIIAAIIILSAVMCKSRNAIFSIFLFMVFRQFYRISPVIGFFTFIVLIIVYQAVSYNIEGIILALGLEEYFRIETFESGSGRLIAWAFGWERISEHPLIGGGIGYTDWYYRINYDFLSMLGHQGNAHNSYITFWLDTGIFGLLAYIAAFITSFVKGARDVISSIPAMYAILFSAFFESWLTASLNPFTIQALIVLTLVSTPGIRELAQNHEEPEEPTVDENIQPIAEIQ